MSLQKIVIETAFGRFAIDETADAKMASKLQSVFPHQALFELINFLGPKTIVDIGAHIGTVSVPLAKKYKVIAFEPNPASLRFLKHNAELNGVFLDARGKGLANVSGRARILERMGNAGANSLAPGAEVEVSILDHEVQEADFVKIDVEGMELKVLGGGKKLIEQSRPAIYFEVNLSALRAHNAKLRELEKFFKKHNYALYFWDKKLFKLPSLALAVFLVTPRSFLLGGPAAPFDVLALPAERAVGAGPASPHLIMRYLKSQYARFF